MRADEFDRRLDRAWSGARASGVIAESTAEIRRHASGYIPAAWRVRPPRRLIDLGSGVGVPGVHLADLLGSTELILVDSAAQRCDTARSAVESVALAERVMVVHARVDDLARQEKWRECADAVVGRLFGPPAELAECGVPLVALGGRMVVSVSDSTLSWWRSAPLRGLGARFEATWSTPAGSYMAVVKDQVSPAHYPRRTPARRRAPWPAD